MGLRVFPCAFVERIFVFFSKFFFLLTLKGETRFEKRFQRTKTDKDRAVLIKDIAKGRS